MKPTARKIKEKFFYPTPVFGQLVALVNQADVESVIRKNQGRQAFQKVQNKRPSLHYVSGRYLSNKIPAGLVCLVSR